jgi:hypothetical protein
MKKIFFSVVLLLLVAVACHKKDDVVASSKKDLLCAVTWKYYQYYINYNQPNTQLVFSLNKQNNSLDLSKARIKYNLDGTYTEIDETGTRKSGTYKLNADETVIELSSNNTVTTIRIAIIDTKGFQWTSMDVNTVGVMIPE